MQHSRSATPSAHAFRCALRACSRASQWQHALDILFDVQSAGVLPTPRCLAYATVACVQSRQQQEVQVLVDELTATESSSFDAFTYRALISAHSYLKQYQQCVDSLRSMRTQGHALNSAAVKVAVHAYSKLQQ
eukprot:13193-Heterococcus_DN1.PRE.4